MENYYGNKQGQSGQSGQTKTAEKDRGFNSSRPSFNDNENGGADTIKTIASEAQNRLKEGKEQATELIKNLDKQVRDNPWAVIAGVAVVAFILASVMKKSR